MNCSECPFVNHCNGAVCPVSPHSKQEDYEESKTKGEINKTGKEKVEEDFEIPF